MPTKCFFYEVGFALMQIRDNRLYRENHGTFEEYCKSKWNMSRPRAYELIDGYKVVENVNHGTQSLPPNERIVRPLTRIKDPDEQREVYQKAVETAPSCINNYIGIPSNKNGRLL